VISALLAGVGGILFVARVGLGDPQVGTWTALDSIAAVSIGGASLSGGVGTVLGTFIGVVILSVLNNIMNLLGVPPTLQPAVKGLVILAAVYLNSARDRR
jgi:ribose/xylose/arabinose/galactoside ABC-type transport system permease subunit